MSLWYASKLAKDQNNPSLPENMSINENEIPKNDLPKVFADFFEKKYPKLSLKLKSQLMFTMEEGK